MNFVVHDLIIAYQFFQYFKDFFHFLKLFINLDEDLIKWGWPEDVWFHVDKFSSAHVYLRLQYVSKYHESYFINKHMTNKIIFCLIVGPNNR